jgi:hypothetical protein
VVVLSKRSAPGFNVHKVPHVCNSLLLSNVLCTVFFFVFYACAKLAVENICKKFYKTTALVVRCGYFFHITWQVVRESSTPADEAVLNKISLFKCDINTVQYISQSSRPSPIYYSLAARIRDLKGAQA